VQTVGCELPLSSGFFFIVAFPLSSLVVFVSSVSQTGARAISACALLSFSLLLILFVCCQACVFQTTSKARSLRELCDCFYSASLLFFLLFSTAHCSLSFLFFQKLLIDTVWELLSTFPVCVLGEQTKEFCKTAQVRRDFNIHQLGLHVLLLVPLLICSPSLL
jgi:hypothetical protein